MRPRTCVLLAIAAALAVTACAGPAADRARLSYAVYAEYARDANKLMKNGLNRRVFNKVESQAGPDITLNADGSITLQPGTYHLTGTSTVTMQTTYAPPVPKHDNTYPGYSMVYPVAVENAGRATIEQAIAIGTPNTALDLAPSVFDIVYTAPAKIDIAVGHQSGDDLHNEVYLSVYEVQGQKSDYHAVARISIVRLN